MILVRPSSGLPAALVLTFAAGVCAGATLSAGFAGPGAPWSAERPASAGITASAPAASARARGSYSVEVLQVIDGDTFLARVKLWPGLDVTTKVRLRGIDAPELHARCTQEEDLAQAARRALWALLAQGDVGIGEVGLDKYGGRVLASASTRGTADVSAALLAAGVARSYSGGRREGWCGISAAR